MLLGGSCGGYSINDGVLESHINIERFNPLSTSFRFGTGQVRDIINNQDRDEFGLRKFSPCPACQGEHTRPPHEILVVCPTNNKPIPPCY